MMDKMTNKTTDALRAFYACIGRRGIWADPSRYRFQCWTRDLVLASMATALAHGKKDVVRRHLDELSRRQRTNGQIPIVFLERTWPFLIDKIKRSIRVGKPSFMLRRWMKGELWNLTPGTRDSELLYALGMHLYADGTGDRSLLEAYSDNVAQAFSFIEENLMWDRLMIGCDWRDTMEKQLGEKALLTNNALLYFAYTRAGAHAKAALLRERINTRFWTGSSYVDYVGATRFDPLGGALAILCGVVPEDREQSVVAGFRSVDTPYGVAIKCRHNPISVEEAEVIERTDGEVVWPFVVGFTIMALVKMGEVAFAREQFEKLLRMNGFREWYDPATGKGYGAQEQLWSAVMFLRAADALKSVSE